MFTSDKKPSGVSNWFFSLRRQPKKQKSLDSSKLLQKSCVDLSNAGVTGGSSEQDLLFRTKPSKLKLNNNSSNNNNNLDDGLSSTSNSCTNCCCKFSSKTSSPSFGVSPIDDIEQCDQMRRVLITNEENYSAIDGQDDDYDDVETSERLQRHHLQLKQQQHKFTNNFSNNILLYNKKEEFSRTTRTITTRVVTKATINGNDSTTIVTTPSTVSSSSSNSNGRVNNSNNIHHRIGLVFNENGQLINRRQLLNAKNRDGLIFDECGRLLYTDTDETSSSLTPISVLDDSTIEFIDSSSQNSDIQNRANLHNKCSCNGSKLTLSSSIMSSCKSEWDCNNKQVNCHHHHL